MGADGTYQNALGVRLETFDFEAPRDSGYPWGQWLDGAAWELRQGQQFRCAVRSLARLAKYHARRRGVKLRYRTSGPLIVIQAVKP